VNLNNTRCEDVLQEISNYIDGEVPSELRVRMENHLAGCAHCHAILDGTKNIIALVADGRLFELPLGLASRLYRKVRETDNDSL
jgi:anti-sigma factor (TIGR02949 family)